MLKQVVAALIASHAAVLSSEATRPSEAYTLKAVLQSPMLTEALSTENTPTARLATGIIQDAGLDKPWCERCGNAHVPANCYSGKNRFGVLFDQGAKNGRNVTPQAAATPSPQAEVAPRTRKSKARSPFVVCEQASLLLRARVCGTCG